jgi:hypothetical protein
MEDNPAKRVYNESVVNARKTTKYANMPFFIGHAHPKNREKCRAFFFFAGFSGPFSYPVKNFFRVQTAVRQTIRGQPGKIIRKKIWQFEKRSYLCTRFRRRTAPLRGGSGKRENIEFLRWRDSVCRKSGEAGRRDTDESKVKKYKQFLQ